MDRAASPRNVRSDASMHQRCKGMAAQHAAEQHDQALSANDSVSGLSRAVRISTYFSTSGQSVRFE